LKRETTKIRAAVIGLGKMGFLHAGILNLLPDVHLMALCDKSRLITRFCEKLFNNIYVVENVERLSTLNLDLVYVTTPIHTHHVITKHLYENEIAKNIFVEKTLASNGAEAKELCELSLRFGGKNMVGYVRRFMVTFRKAKELVDQGVLGNLTTFSGHAYSSDFIDNGNSRELNSRGGVLRDLGCHLFDLALWFFRDLEVDRARGSMEDNSTKIRVYNSYDVEGQLTVSCTMKDYRLPEVNLTVNGSKGVLMVNDDRVELNMKNGECFSWYRHDLGDNVTFHLGATEFYREDAGFISSVINDFIVEPSFHTASMTDRFIEKIENKIENI